MALPNDPFLSCLATSQRASEDLRLASPILVQKQDPSPLRLLWGASLEHLNDPSNSSSLLDLTAIFHVGACESDNVATGKRLQRVCTSDLVCAYRPFRAEQQRVNDELFVYDGVAVHLTHRARQKNLPDMVSKTAWEEAGR